MSRMEQYKKELLELQNKTLEELGNIENHFGNKYRGQKIRDIYSKNPEYLKWVKELVEENYIGNDYYFQIEYSRQAMILYYDLIEFLKSGGK